MQIQDITSLFNHKYTISELEKYTRSKKDNIDKNLYRKCKILIIDDYIADEDYLFKSSISFLKNQYNCNIVTKIDLDNLADAAGYDIIICDNDGVGIKLGGSNKDGIWLLSQLQNQYPDKIYVLFSSMLTSIRRIKRAKAHELWDKEELSRNSEENGEGGFSDYILNIMSLYANPSKRWEDIRTQLLQSGISIHSVAQLESAYVKSIIKERPEVYSALSGKINLSNDNNTDVHKFIKSAGSIINTTISLLALI